MQWIPLSVGFFFLLYASIHDFKTREVPDLVSYGLLLFAISYGVGNALILESWVPLFQMLLGLGILLFIALIMYYSGQWGGADSKLLIGIGALLGLGFGKWDALLFVLFLLFSGAFYGILYAFILALINRKRVLKSFLKRLREKRILWWRKRVLGLSFVLLLLLLIIPWELKLFCLGIIITLYLGFYLWLCVKVIEEEVLIKEYPVSKLTEGDWIKEEVKVKGKLIVGPKDLGITKEQILTLKKLKVKRVLVKEGIPFVPSFLVAFILFIVLKEILQKYLFFL